MKCIYKNTKCEYAGKTIMVGCKELGEKEGIHEYGICYNDEIKRRPEDCKKMPRIYISGPISGHDIEERRKAFDEVEANLRRQGYDTINPTRNGLPANSTTHEHMRRDFELLMECDYIYMMHKWTHSKGCMVELEVATAIGLPVMFEESSEMIKFV